jgi:DNA-binding SARP family transcriptional activator
MSRTGSQGRRDDGQGDAPLAIDLLGVLQIRRGDELLALPASRKTRALLGYLALASRPVSRQKLCDLLFEVPDDPRAALRWSLTKLRPLVDDDERPRLVSTRDQLRLAVEDAQIDALGLQRQGADPTRLGTAELESLLQRFRGPLLEDAELPERPEYSAWLAAQRADFAAIERRLLGELAGRLPAGDARLPALWQRRIDLDPLDEQAYVGFVKVLRELGRSAEAEAVVTAGERALRAAGLAPSVWLRAPARPQASETAASPRTVASGPPVVAVMPFRDLSREPLPDYLVEGLLEGVVHELSRFRSLTVLARLSTEVYRDRVLDPVSIGSALQADILVGGTLASDGTRLRIRWTIAETRGGRLVGSGEEAHPVEDPFGLSSDVATRIAVGIEPLAQAEALVRTERKQAVTRAAYDHFLRGLYGAFSPGRSSDYPSALRSFRAALAADPGFAPAAAFLPWAAIAGNLIGSIEELQAYGDSARLAVRQAGDDARTLAIGGSAVLFLTGDFEMALDSVERALRLNPNEYSAWIQAGWVFMVGGEYERPMDCFARAERLNSSGVAEVACRSMRAFCHFFHGELEPSEALSRRTLIDSPTNFWNWVMATAIAVERGDLPVARERARRVVELAPEGLRSIQLAAIPWRQNSYIERIRAALRAAGVPE